MNHKQMVEFAQALMPKGKTDSGAKPPKIKTKKKKKSPNKKPM